jgi:hypothetical protein
MPRGNKKAKASKARALALVTERAQARPAQNTLNRTQRIKIQVFAVLIVCALTN